MLLLEPAAGLACQASREGSVELFEGARCHLGSRAAILAARQRLCRLSALCRGAGSRCTVLVSLPLLLEDSVTLGLRSVRLS